MALTPLHNTGFECGYPGATARSPLTSNATGLITSGAWQEETTVVKNGSRALKSPVITGSHYYKFLAGGNSRISARFYVRFEDLPGSGGERGVCYFGGGSGKSVWVTIRNASGVVRFYTHGEGLSPATAFGPNPVSADVWYLVEVVADNSGSTEFIYARIDGGTEHSQSAAIAAGTFSEFFFGHPFTSMQYGLGSYYDDLIFGSWDGSGDKYWGDGKGILLKPSGRAVAGSTVTMVGDNPLEFGAGGTGASADDLDNLYENLDEVPMEQSGGNYVWQSAAATALNAPDCYLEFPIEDTTETAINSARMVAMVRDSSNTGAHNADIKARAGGADTSLVFGDPGTTITARQALIPAPGGSWDQTEVNAITARFGYASDASPEPWLLGVLVEVDCAIVTAVDGTATPGTIGVAAALPSATPAGGAGVTPATISATMAVPAPDKSAGATKTPTTLAALLGLPAPTPQAGVTKTPDTLAAALGLPAATPQGGASKTPATLAALLGLPTPSASGAGRGLPSSIATVVALPAATVSGEGKATPTPVATLLTFPTPSPSGGASVTPATVATALNVLAPLASAGVTVTPAVVTAVLSLASPTASGTAVVTPATVAVLLDVLGPLAGAAVTAAPAPVDVDFTLPQALGSGAGVVVPSPVGLQIGLLAPLAQGDTVALAQTISVVTGIPLPQIDIEATALPQPVAVVIGVPPALAAVVKAIVALFTADRLNAGLAPGDRVESSLLVTDNPGAQMTPSDRRDMSLLVRDLLESHLEAE